ncbi:hypothetical protein ACQ4M4_14520 [Leptolyngbya sp. AN02str]|uniref:hypothetical protein n=1 Tax=Leptolyngbya sp. AN02str TaxID=3423363 RepID=UPI003D31AB2E
MNRLKQTAVALSIVAVSGIWGVANQASPTHAQTVQSAPILIAATPVTYMTVIDRDHVVVQISEGEFLFHGWLERTSGSMFVGEDGQVRVMYDMDTKQMVVINVRTGDEFYNYTFSNVDEGSL